MPMKIGLSIDYAAGFAEAAERVREFEAAGLDQVSVAEAYSFDSVSQLGYLAGQTSTVELVSGVFPMYSRTPTNLAMTAAGLDYVSNGRFVMGIGASGPQVIEGFHGVKYDAPIGRAREVAEICRLIWRRERSVYDGRYYKLPLTKEDGGTGLGKPLKLINHPVRERIPMVLAAIGPKNVELAAELFEGWQPIFFYPEKLDAAWGEPLAAGRAKRDPALGELEIHVGAAVAITEDADVIAAAEAQVRAHLALYIGGMGARGKNFYNTLATRYGFGDAATRIQDLYLAGEKQAAAEAVPAELVAGTALIGPRSHVAERLAALSAVGVTSLHAQLVGGHADQLRQLGVLKELTAEL